ncbi:hypothetical protein INS49_004356 [Diaporthe citri]|uniref:uncharacterized protein n=1 Tax=Diaporthe citri TaxID=83186 RepID=UPI001C81B89C|nr:uncharacterized protein INS49_004356 [Diaporthe citri]KAG6354339.1 hypothetical protein INS49_004356 [Diaporthe citri]
MVTNKSSQVSSASTVSTQTSQIHRDLLAASAKGNEEKVRSVLKEGSPWSSSKDQAALRKALQKASARDNLNIIDLLLRKGAEVDAQTEDEFPALFRAAQTGQTAVLVELLSQRPDLEARDRSGQTPLFVASVKGYANIVELLLARGAVVDALDKDARTPLLALAADKSSASAWNTGASEVVRLLVSHGSNVNFKDKIGRTPLLWAATNGHYDLVKTLLETGADVSAVNNRGRTALHLAVDSTDTTHIEEIMKILLQYQADARAISDGGWTPLHNAAQKGLTCVVERLLEAGASINARLSNGMTALHWAAFNGFEDVVNVLISEEEADLGIKDGFGRAPWLCAAEHGHYELIELLSPVRNSHRLPRVVQDACKAFTATVVEFKEFGEKQRKFKHSVYDVLYGWNQKNERPKVPVWTSSAGVQNDFKWIHLPTNNIAWVETLLIKWFIESGCRDLEGYKALTKCLEQEHRGPLPHGNFMRPYCQRISSLHPSEEPGLEPDLLDIRPSPVRRSESNLSQMTITQRVPGGDGKIVLFMPYLHYETDEGRQKMTDAMKLVGAADETSSISSSPNLLLLQAYLHGKTKIHPRRTLDQFFYHGLDTSARDRDQVVYRYCESQDLVVTCFPGRWEHQTRDPLNVLDGIMEEMNAKTRPAVRSAYDLAILISSRCSGMFSRHRSDDQNYQFLDMFESSVGRVTEELTQLFHNFEEASTQSSQWLRPKRRHKLLKRSKDSHESFDPLLDIRAETSLLTEVRDIRDELNILTMVINSQLFTLGDFRSCLIDELSNDRYGPSKKVSSFVMDIRKRMLDQERRLKVHKRDIDAMDEQSERLYKSLRDLLDLKQKHSNALEARFSSEQALAAAREGQTIMVFTIVTIIFMPMSFIAAYFGISMDSFGDNLPDSYVNTWTFGGGLAISVLFILMAFTVVDITKAVEAFYSFTKRRFNTNASPPQEALETQPLYRTITPAKGGSNQTVVYSGEMDEGGSPGKMYREYSKASGVSVMTRTLSHISSWQGTPKEDVEKQAARGRGAYLYP